jgi:hypothetical protein
MLPAEPTKLFNFQTIRHYLLVLGRGIIFPLTLSASQVNNISHKSSNFPYGEPDSLARTFLQAPEFQKFPQNLKAHDRI